ncbi:unnamed protein product (macronuclear) [Paramecium tetraurelia]|uniref:Uncharacterized protein n=1 Tax=Paramecium tetraurelia TaxID=5888 RepID=A0D4B8_PARTE|nr:uncharacterized protein GSPATT00013351001 [Paramecium tetraurelia]CAK77885.1 unnamed protein product [Paramecium tetraurelia]|eukprot:XP_001445282.1 hypothetical protein (macronuclear) [Paramecium tetraurelia strain d4-2]
MQELLAQKYAELSQNTLDNVDFSKAEELYKEILKNLNEDLSIEQIKQLGQQFLEFLQVLQQDEFIQRKRAKEETQEKDQLLHKEYPQLQDKLLKLKQNCQDIDQSAKKINETLKKLPEIEEANRKSMKDKFYEDVKDVKDKIQQEEIDAQKFAEENLKIREDMQALIAQYEQKEKEFWEKVKQNEEEQKNDTKKYMEQFEKMQGDAQKAMQEKQLIQDAQKQLNDKKMKLQVYKGKQNEFIETFEKSTSTFQSLTVEFLKLAFKAKEDEEKSNLNQQRADKANLLAVEIAQKNADLKLQIENVEKEKDKLRAEILELNNQKKLQSQNQQQQKSNGEN